MLPIVAAVCGMAVPALIYAAFNAGDPARLPGWGIPMATDIAFAVAILAVVGRHLPSPLRTFLLTLAIGRPRCNHRHRGLLHRFLSFLPLIGADAARGFGYLQRGRAWPRLNSAAPPNWVATFRSPA